MECDPYAGDGSLVLESWSTREDSEYPLAMLFYTSLHGRLAGTGGLGDLLMLSHNLGYHILYPSQRKRWAQPHGVCAPCWDSVTREGQGC